MTVSVGLQNNLCRSLAMSLVLLMTESALALPPETDPPEEVLRAEIITGVRSAVDGQPISSRESAERQSQLQQSPPQTAQVSPQVRQVIGLLKLRKFIKTFLPFIPIR